MLRTILDIKINYDDFSKSEKKIADFLLTHADDEVPLYITEFAKICQTSEATVVRFAKRLGFDGFSQLKIAMAKQSNNRPVNENITPGDSAKEIFVKICDDVYCSLEKTKRALSGVALQRACDAIITADEVLIFGLGNSASIAMDAAHKFFRLGVKAHAYTDNHMQAIAAAHTNEKSVVMGISHSGASKDVVRALQLAKENSAVTIAVTHMGKSPIEKVSDIVLATVSDETNYRILGLNSRITQLTIIDAMYSYLVCHFPHAPENVAITEDSLHDKKI